MIFIQFNLTIMEVDKYSEAFSFEFTGIINMAGRVAKNFFVFQLKSFNFQSIVENN